jgi:hypothetical protein
MVIIKDLCLEVLTWFPYGMRSTTIVMDFGREVVFMCTTQLNTVVYAPW